MCKLLDRNFRALKFCAADRALNNSLCKAFFLACRFLDRDKLRNAGNCLMLKDLDLDGLNFLAAYVAEECYFNFAVSLACSCAVADLDASLSFLLMLWTVEASAVFSSRLISVFSPCFSQSQFVTT